MMDANATLAVSFGVFTVLVFRSGVKTFRGMLEGHIKKVHERFLETKKALDAAKAKHKESEALSVCNAQRIQNLQTTLLTQTADAEKMHQKLLENLRCAKEIQFQMQLQTRVMDWKAKLGEMLLLLSLTHVEQSDDVSKEAFLNELSKALKG